MGKKYPKISIITPSFNQSQYIEKTIQSVLSQKYPNLEYIVMDGGSKDNTVKILKKYSGKLIWISKKDKGQSDAINKGLKRSTGEIVAYLNSDDIYLPGTLFKVAEFFNSNSCMWLTGKCKIINKNGGAIRSGVSLWKNFWLSESFKSKQKEILLILNYISQPATFWKKEAMEKIGYFNEKLEYTMDYEYWLRMIHQYELGILPEDLAAFRVHPQSKGVRKTKDQLREGISLTKEYTSSNIILALHKLHDRCTHYMYNM